MLWLLQLLWPPLHTVAVAALLFACLRLFGPDLLECLDCLADKSKRKEYEDDAEEFGENFEEIELACLDSSGRWGQRFVGCCDGRLLVRRSGQSVRNAEAYSLTDLTGIQLTRQTQQQALASLVFRLDFKSAHSLHLAVESATAASDWLQLLQAAALEARPELTQRRHRVEESKVVEKLRLHNDKFEQEFDSGQISIELLVKLFKEFGVFVTRGDLKAFVTRQLGKSKVESLSETVCIVGALLEELDNCEVFDKHAMSSAKVNLISAVGLIEFSTESQAEPLDLPDASQLLRSLAAQDSDLADLLLLTRRDFRCLLNSKAMTMPLKPEMLLLRAPLDSPITDYFVSSSHNTYLMEDQITGRSDCQAYEIALKKNCRCIELDIHNGTGCDPVITHGGTMTSRIRFEDAIKTIRKFAFVASEYPLTLSFENHCSIEQQERMAAILKEQIGDCLYVNENAHLLKQMPSPEELKGKIIIKNKKLHTLCLSPSIASTASQTSMREAEEDTDDDSDTEAACSPSDASVTPDAADEEAEEAKEAKLETRDSADSPPDSQQQQQQQQRARSGSIKPAKEISKKSTQKKLKVAQSLSDMVSVCRPVKFKGQQYARDNYLPIEMSSLVESKLDKKQWTRKDGEDANKFVLHTQYQLVRVYPSGFRTNSSNYSPVTGWRYGCQMVALNYQTRCENMELNDGLFQLNGSCGYVPKPKILTDPDTKFNPFNPCPSLARSLHLEVVSAVSLRVGVADEKSISPYVKATIFGVPGDDKKDQSKRAEQGYNPRWSHRCFQDNNLLRVPDLAHLRLEVKDKVSGKSVGQFTAPIMAFNNGYRRLFLKDQKDCPTVSELWIKFHLSAVTQP